MSGIHHCDEHGFTEEKNCPNCGKTAEQILHQDEQRNISGFMSWALRHEPDNAGIEVDDNGWTSIDELVSAANDQNKPATEEAIRGVVSLDGKGRYELSGGNVRAVYAHSFPVTIDSVGDDVPDTLLHGTASENVQSILQEGLKPMRREKVHLTPDEEEAADIGNRHSDDISILEINAKQLQEDGQEVEERSDVIYTTDAIDPSYITVQ